MADVAIRLLSADDAEAYRSIRLATLRIEPGHFGSLYEDEAGWPLETFRAAIRADRIFGAFSQQAIVGVARLQSHRGVKERHKASVHGVFVQPGWRGQGVGRAMLSTVVAAARSTSERLVLSVTADNIAAISLYERLGFERFGIEPQARKHEGRYSDVVSMSLRLSGR